MVLTKALTKRAPVVPEGRVGQLAVSEDFGGILGEDAKDLVFGQGFWFGPLALGAGRLGLVRGIHVKSGAADK